MTTSKQQAAYPLRFPSDLRERLTEALEAGGSLVGGVSVIYDQEHGYEAFQAVLVPDIKNDAA